MLDQDIVLAKAATVDRCLRRVRQTTGGDPARLHDIDVQDIFVLNLQRAVQAILDLAVHIVASNGWGLPDTLKRSFSIIEEHGVIESELAARLRAMVGFRNIAVHAYQELDLAVLKSILTRNLVDLEDFCAAALALEGSDSPV